MIRKSELNLQQTFNHRTDNLCRLRPLASQSVQANQVSNWLLGLEMAVGQNETERESPVLYQITCKMTILGLESIWLLHECWPTLIHGMWLKAPRQRATVVPQKCSRISFQCDLLANGRCSPFLAGDIHFLPLGAKIPGLLSKSCKMQFQYWSDDFCLNPRRKNLLAVPIQNAHLIKSDFFCRSQFPSSFQLGFLPVPFHLPNTQYDNEVTFPYPHHCPLESW